VFPTRTCSRTTTSIADAIIFGSLFDHNTADGDLKLVNAASLAIDEANASGLTDGRLFGIVHCDYQVNNKLDELTYEEAAVTGAKYLVDEIGAIGDHRPRHLGLAEAVFKELQRPEHDPTAVIISPSATSPSLTDIDVRDGDKPGLFWRTAPPDSQLAADLAARMLTEGIASATVIYANDSYGSGLAGAFQSSFTGAYDEIAFTDTAGIVSAVEKVSKVTPGDGSRSSSSAPRSPRPARSSTPPRPTPSTPSRASTSATPPTTRTSSRPPRPRPSIRGSAACSRARPRARTTPRSCRATSRSSWRTRRTPRTRPTPTTPTWLAVYGAAWAEFQREGVLTGLNVAFGLQQHQRHQGRRGRREPRQLEHRQARVQGRSQHQHHRRLGCSPVRPRDRGDHRADRLLEDQ
jgi:hypothetical protein